MTQRNAGTSEIANEEEMRVAENLTWVVDLKEKLESSDPSEYASKWGNFSVYKWPNDLAAASGVSRYRTPCMASFGPYHHGEEHLQPMEHHKERALHRILNRSVRPRPLSRFVASLKRIQQELWDSYDNLYSNLSMDSFLRMMLLDGCFILELLRTRDPNQGGPALYDPVFSPNGKLSYSVIQHDMLLIENQIPLPVLIQLLKVEASNMESPPNVNHNEYLNSLIFRHYGFENSQLGGPSLHILDVYRRRLITGGAMEEDRPHLAEGFIRSVWSQCQLCMHVVHKGLWHLCLAIPIFIFRLLTRPIPEPGYVRSATRFHEAGIEFRKRTDSGLEITFDQGNGVLTLPYIDMDDYTAPIYMNLIAFERMHLNPSELHKVTTYIAFMYNLIDTAEDVSLLSSQGVLRNQLGSDEDAAAVFNNLADGITYWPDDDLQEQLRAYVASDWNAARANLKHHYFKNPWSILSVFAAIVLLILTFFVAVFAVLEYARHRK
ncbi:putative UPF0481 protein At3g02645 [Nymphaea colorata]|nr:putative UPF0481 protein At3g02645 [Nymphaea colorata]